MVTLKELERYHKKKKRIAKSVLKTLKDKEIVYGARARNMHMRRYPFLQRHTEDYDIYAVKAKREAMEAERKLDKMMKFNAFKTKPALYPGTHKVVSNVTGSTVADFTKPETKVPYVVINGVRYKSLPAIKKHIKKTLKDPEAKFRHAKDKDALNRIKIYEKLEKARRAKKVKQKKGSFW